MLITTHNWPLFAAKIASPADPMDYNQSAVDRLMTVIDPYVVRVRGIKPQFNSLNSIQMIDFQTASERAFYEKAWDRYLAEKAKLESSDGPGSRFNILVQFLKFRQAAEMCRSYHIAKAMYECVNYSNEAAVASLNFRPSISKIVKILMDDFNVKRDDISLIWGGSQVSRTKKEKAKIQLTDNPAALELLLSEGIDLDDLGLGEDVEIKEQIVFADHLRMGSQTKEARQSEIDRFQRGNSKYCLFSFKAGGVGLSLHHTDELCTSYNKAVPGCEEYEQLIAKVNSGLAPDKQIKPGQIRRKESGYVFEEDIRFVTTRPRRLFCAPTYSAIELVQALGRCPRLTSLSNTNQLLIFYRGTIEERVAAITSVKLRCLSKVVRMKEHWEECIIGAKPEVYVEKQIEDSRKLIEDDEQDLGTQIGES